MRIMYLSYLKSNCHAKRTKFSEYMKGLTAGDIDEIYGRISMDSASSKKIIMYKFVSMHTSYTNAPNFSGCPKSLVNANFLFFAPQ